MAEKTAIKDKTELFGSHSDFTLFPNGEYFIEHFLGNFVWSPQDNTVTLFKGMYSDYCDKQKVPCGTFDNVYLVESKVGTDFKLILK